MSAPQLGGAALALGGMALVAMQFMGGSAENAKVDEKAGRLKKTLTNAGLYPQPETGESRLRRFRGGAGALELELVEPRPGADDPYARHLSRGEHGLVHAGGPLQGSPPLSRALGSGALPTSPRDGDRD